MQLDEPEKDVFPKKIKTMDMKELTRNVLESCENLSEDQLDGLLKVLRLWKEKKNTDSAMDQNEFKKLVEEALYQTDQNRIH